MTMETLEKTHHADPASDLAEEIELLEARLKTMGMDGDCAYERALSKVYDSLLIERRRKLASLLASA